MSEPFAPTNQQANPYASYPPPPEVPTFQVTTMSHVGALIFWFNQRRTVQGSYAQCDSALRSAQTQNLIFGWWSFFSILILNWVTLLHNSNARKRLNRDAQQAREYALWWHTYVGTNQR
ncbi:hypothetical protein [Mycolicibacterium fluoranthenivorans]|jgi:hypothetical protein|uniref:Transmembrane protein n=1 Tax=Mycolicibacterium fluoranthenivorans TaxID=258505 RepID=A0A7X5ZCN7_9MYCO|nr:hypothetical protein [Mycolicibacterium fluoranthenivorans]MCV7357402.1 hypothetical protein [Mycolicibacterium fluoranthenivorans]NIH95215.1 hypothetical protein [Mycolicibacterium fluoranthenivorans]